MFTSGLRDEPLVDKELRVLGKAEIELTVSLHRVDRLNCLVNLVVQTLDFLEIKNRDLLQAVLCLCLIFP